jgi:hypothetical protein
MKRLILRSFLLGTFLVHGVPGRAWAQGDPPAPPASAPPTGSLSGDDQKREVAKERFRKGVEAYEERRYKDAVDLLLEADGLMHSPAFAYNIGLAYEAMGDVPSALRWLRDYLREAPEADDRANVEKRIGGLETALQQRGVQQATILSTPSGATVVVDGKPVGVTPWTGELLPGRHDVSVQLGGYTESRRYLDVRAHRADDFPFELAPAAAAPAVPAAPAAPAGDVADAPSAGPRIAPLTWITLGTGAAVLGGALVFELSRASAVEEAESAPQVDYEEKLDAAKSRQTTARVLAGVGGAIAITGGVLLFLDLNRKDPPPIAVGCTGTGCFASARGAF